MLQEPGHLLPLYGIAKKLQKNGHRPVFMGIADFKNEIISYGFEFIEETTPPKGKSLKDSKWNFLIPEFIQKSIDNVRDCRGLNKAVMSNINYAKQHYNPDLFLLDDLHIPDIFPLYSFNIPVIIVSTYLSQNKDSNVPPIQSTLIPQNTIWNKIRMEMAWFKVSYLDRLYSYWGYFKQIKVLAKKMNYPFKERLNLKRSLLLGFKEIPTIVLCPEEFDFPRDPQPSRFFVAPNLILNRPPIDFNWDEIDLSKPIVYCCLGTQANIHFNGCFEFFSNVIKIFSDKPEYTLIVSIWKELKTSLFKDLPPNIKIYNEVPQIEILKKAKLSITHGGLGSIKESILSGVPMLVYPVNLASDQNGNAARIEYHKLGLRGVIRKEPIHKMRKKIELLLTEQYFVENVFKMKDIFEKYEKEDRTISLIESFLKENKSPNKAFVLEDEIAV